MNQSPHAVVIGALNLDIIIKGLPKFAEPGEQVNGRSITLSPGGKGRNIAVMLAAWLAPGQVSMVSKFVQDRYGLYHIPLQSLKEAHVQTDSIILETNRLDDLPTLAVFLNTLDGQRANYYLPGENETLSPDILEKARPLLQKLADNNGFLVLSLEMPLPTATHALSIAAELGIRVMLDPGGQPPELAMDTTLLFAQPIYLIKPNVDEASRLTGLLVHDLVSAQQAANQMLSKGIKNVLITHGENGAYAFTSSQSWHISAPNLDIPPHADATGCGDQVLAVLCAEMLNGRSFEVAAYKAARAGSIQFCQAGLTPVSPNHPQL